MILYVELREGLRPDSYVGHRRHLFNRDVFTAFTSRTITSAQSLPSGPTSRIRGDRPLENGGALKEATIRRSRLKSALGVQGATVFGEPTERENAASDRSPCPPMSGTIFLRRGLSFSPDVST